MKQGLSTLAYRLKKLATQGTLTHGNKGKSNRPFRPDKLEILRIAQEKYPAFGIAHLCELLKEREGISVPNETLRRWLERPHKYHPKKKRMRRECSSCFGDLLQIDGSFDVRFGQEKTCLMNIVDDNRYFLTCGASCRTAVDGNKQHTGIQDNRSFFQIYCGMRPITEIICNTSFIAVFSCRS